MDSRIALKANAVLRFDGGCEFTIIDELARGGSSIVYNAFYYDSIGGKKIVRIKECYPFKCNLSRGADNRILVPRSEEALFEAEKEKMCAAYKLGNEFFQTKGLTNLTANSYNLFYANNTVYVVFAYAQGKELSYSNYDSVKDSIAVVGSVSEAIRKIHNKGYLYLDVKPSNVFTLAGTTDLIQLFDFDTLVPISEPSKALWNADRISYTKGFAALEQQTGDFQRLGKHSDVYGIGALLFYMLFNRTPSAFDCEPDAEYNYADSKLAGSSYQDALTRKLTEFFHHTLANYYLDRYSCMETVTEKLTELQKLADLSARFIYSTKIPKAELFLGRSEETKWITEKMQDGRTGCFFVTGIGGIGKSTLVRECIKQNEALFDTVLFINYLGSVSKTISDDYAVQINSVHKDKTETQQAYFERKLGIMREISVGRNNLLVIDNYTGDESDGLAKLSQLGWRIIVISRNKALSEGFECLEIDRISDKVSLLTMFERLFGRKLAESETACAESIIERVAGHTLIVELIARQIGSPLCGLSVQEAAALVERVGFSSIAVEKVGYCKDSTFYQDTVGNIIAGLFETNALSDSKKVILKVVSLFVNTGIPVKQFCAMLEIDNKDELTELHQEGGSKFRIRSLLCTPLLRKSSQNGSFQNQAEPRPSRL